jgi:hypothetical protein
MESKFLTSFNETIAKVRIIDKKTIIRSSKFKFLMSHNGLRNKSMHIFLGNSHGGKSTIARTMLKELFSTKEKIFLWLTEESVDDYETEMYQAGIKLEKGMYHVLSEIDYHDKFLLKTVWNEIVNNNITMLFIDNITTSPWYGDDTKLQKDKIYAIKEMVEKTGICAVIMAHTGGDVRSNFKNLIDQNDMRGNKTPINVTPFLYILQQFDVKQPTGVDTIYSTVRVKKHRSYSVDKVYYRFIYDPDDRIYISDREINYEDIKRYLKGES